MNHPEPEARREAPGSLATDPPYGVSLDPTWRDGVYNALGPAEPGYLQSSCEPALRHLTACRPPESIFERNIVAAPEKTAPNA